MGSPAANFKKKVIFIMGATGTGKSRLSIDIATRFPAEIINSDKIQVYKGLDIVTNKVPEAERLGVPHHLLGEVEDINSDYSAVDFCYDALNAIEEISKSGNVPIIVGGSNSYLHALVEDPRFNFKSKYDCCFVWLDVYLPVLFEYVSLRIDRMVEAGLVDEVRSVFDPKADYSRGIRRAIGVPEMDEYLREEAMADEKRKRDMLASAIHKTKANTWNLVCSQLEKIKLLKNELKWPLHRIDATTAFERRGEESDKAWNDAIYKPCMDIVSDFLGGSPKSGVQILSKNNFILLCPKIITTTHQTPRPHILAFFSFF